MSLGPRMSRLCLLRLKVCSVDVRRPMPYVGMRQPRSRRNADTDEPTVGLTRSMHVRDRGRQGVGRSTSVDVVRQPHSSLMSVSITRPMPTPRQSSAVDVVYPPSGTDVVHPPSTGVSAVRPPSASSDRPMHIGGTHLPSVGASVVGPTSAHVSRKSGVAYTSGPQPVVGVDDTSGVAKPTSADVGTAYQQPTWTRSKPAYASQYAAVRTDVAVHTSAETLTAQSLLLLDHHTASPQSSPHSSIHQWLQTSGTAPPAPSPAESLSSSRHEPQQAFPSSTGAAMMAPATGRSSRASRVSRSTRHTRRSTVSSLAEELISFCRDMTGNLVQVVGHMQAQAEAQRAEAKQREEAQHAETKQREEAQRAEAERREEARRVEAQAQQAEAIKREELLIQMKIATEQASADREKVQLEATQYREQAWLKVKADSDEASRKREQLFMEHELKRQKMLVDANITLQQEKLKMDVNREVANLEALERRETEFHQLQERERERARDAQLKLRELAAQELKKRVHLERELVKQQQQNLLLQKQKEIERV